MITMNKNAFVKKEAAFKGQCMCPVNCTTKKHDSMGQDICAEIKKIYTG